MTSKIPEHKFGRLFNSLGGSAICLSFTFDDKIFNFVFLLLNFSLSATQMMGCNTSHCLGNPLFSLLCTVKGIEMKILLNIWLSIEFLPDSLCFHNIRELLYGLILSKGKIISVSLVADSPS